MINIMLVLSDMEEDLGSILTDSLMNLEKRVVHFLYALLSSLENQEIHLAISDA